MKNDKFEDWLEEFLNFIIFIYQFLALSQNVSL